MYILSQILACIILFGLLAAIRAHAVFWTIVGAVVLTEITITQTMGPFIYVLWGLFVPVAVLLNVAPIRQQLLTGPILKLFRKVLPKMSDTEREALEAGETWLDKTLFSGKPDWKMVDAVPAPQLTMAEQNFINNEVNELCAMLDDWEVSHERYDMPPEAWQYLKDKGFFAMNIPAQYGGKGFSALCQSSVVMKIATRCASAAVTTMVPNSLGPGELLMHYGTDAQKERYLPALADGREIPCFALTSAEAGSDAGALIDSGVICEGQWEGETVIGVRLNWSKRYITLAPVATLLAVAVKFRDPEHLLGDKTDLGITTCLVPTDTPGVNIGQRHFPLNLVFMNGPTQGRDVFLPLDCVIGGPERIGQGWRMLVECLSAGRGISLPALSIGTGKMCYRMTGAYAKIRRQFKVSIGEFEGIQEAMARIGGLTYIMEAARLLTSVAIDEGRKPSVITAIAKYHLTEMARMVISDAMDVHAGRGVMLGPKNYLARAHQGTPVSITVEGANILTRNLIIYGQGAIRCHPYVQTEMELAHEPFTPQTLSRFDKVFCGHVRFALRNAAVAFGYGLTKARFGHTPRSDFIAPYMRQVQWMSSALAFVSDIAMLTLGGALKRKERLSARLGDVLSYLYMATAVIKYYDDNHQPAEDKAHVEWALQYCMYHAQRALRTFCLNFPRKWIGRCISAVVFPLGQKGYLPSDDLSQEVAKAMMSPSAMRDRITQDCYLGTGPDDPVGIMEATFEKLMEAGPAERKVHEAIKLGLLPKQATVFERLEEARRLDVITAQDYQMLTELETLKQSAIAVDVFDPAYFSEGQGRCQNKAQTKVSA